MDSKVQGNPLAVPRGSKKQSVLIGVGIAVLVVLLAGAAYVGGCLLNGVGIPGLSSAGVRRPDLQILPAKGLPTTPADVNGIFDHRQDNSVFVGTGNITGSKKRDASGNVHVSLSYNGPVVEVVVTNQTTIYKDTTAQQFNGRPPIKAKSSRWWGRKTGDRYIADVLV